MPKEFSSALANFPSNLNLPVEPGLAIDMLLHAKQESSFKYNKLRRMVT
jgi:hypothetical protein